jgi:hypothetical protein
VPDSAGLGRAAPDLEPRSEYDLNFSERMKAAAEKAGSAENGDDAIVHDRRGSNSPAHLGAVSVYVTWTVSLLTAIHDVGYLVQMGVDLVR